MAALAVNLARAKGKLPAEDEREIDHSGARSVLVGHDQGVGRRAGNAELARGHAGGDHLDQLQALLLATLGFSHGGLRTRDGARFFHERRWI